MKYSSLPLWFKRTIRPNPKIPHPLSKYSAKDYLDKKMEKYLNYDSGFFVELGSGDGVTLTNTRYFEEYRNWKGILVDPVISNFISCRMYRKNSTTWLAACVSFNYHKETVDLIHAGYMTVSLDLESDLPEVESHLNVAKSYLAKEEIGFHFPMYAKTLDSILNESVAPKNIDFLSIDVEGSEIEVLKGINFNNYTFKYILVESREVMKIEKLLTIHGYFLVEKLASADYLFAHRKIGLTV